MHKLLADMDKKIVIPMGTNNGRMLFESSDEEEEEVEEESECGPVDEYEQAYIRQEMARYAEGASSSQATEYNRMSEVDGIEGYDFKKNPLSVYASYNFDSYIRKELPIDSFRETILNYVDSHQVIVIQGHTGCGKTTQVPQFILDHMREKDEYCNIVVTQPRKIATITVAKRVCEERGWTLGTVCGYQIGLEKKTTNDAILTYVTTGILLQKVIHAKSLQQFTHIIIDEVHERNQDLDFLLLIIRRFLFTNSPGTKVILMSATIDADEFSRYFRIRHENSNTLAPIIRVDKLSQYKKSFFYLEQLRSITDNIKCAIPPFNMEKPEISEGMWQVLVELVSVINLLDEVDPQTNQKVIGSALVFLPGIHEIEEANQKLINHFSTLPESESAIKWDIIPLHSSLPNDEQAKVFHKSKPGHRKIILSTNIAESSITVPDSCYVIDFCLTKVMTVEPTTKYMSLILEWASHVNCDQRAGRVGRTGSGRVYRLVPREFYDEQMKTRGLPEILRAPLERTVLQSKRLNLDEPPRQVLSLAMNPPNLRNIQNTILSLKEMGALLQMCRGEFSCSDGDITFMGIIMATLPIDVRLSKLIVLGHMFNCLNEAVIIAAGCSVHNVFSIPFQQRFNAYKKQLMWADGSFSDLIALYNLYRVWQAYKRDNQFESVHAEIRWCSMNFVNLKGLREWNLIVEETMTRLEQMKIQPVPGQANLSADERALILKIIAAGAFYPNYFVRSSDACQISERDAVRMVAGRDPFCSVYMTGMEIGQPVPIYTRAIKDLLGYSKDNTNVSVGYDNSSKIYIEFKNTNKPDHVTVTRNGRLMVTDAIPGKIPRDVYEVIRKRQLRYEFKLKILPFEAAWRFGNKQGITRTGVTSDAKSVSSAPIAHTSYTTDNEYSCYSNKTLSPIPSLDTEWITIKITEFIDASHFWVTRMESEANLTNIERILNKTVLREVHKSDDAVKLGGIYAARFHEDNMFYRCKVLSMVQGMAQIIFIDYGNIEKVQMKNLYILPDLPDCKLPPLAIECMLHGVQPSRKMNPKGIWSDKANDYWGKQTMNILLYGQVHSVVDNVVYLYLFRNKQKEVRSINEHMLATGQADPAVESFLSKADHEKRLQVRKADNPNLESNRLSVDQIKNYTDMEMPHMMSNCKTVVLKGPFSPLEMKVYGCIESSMNKNITVEHSSVNTVLLDNEPEDYHNRLLVAGYVSQSMTSNNLNLRQTSLMPNVPGLPMLLCLLFCPRMEAKVTNDKTRVASILCGLGYSKSNNRSIYPAHDLVLSLDTELTEDEINRINQIRFNMNLGIQLMSDINQGNATPKNMTENQLMLRTNLMDLIYAERKTVERVSVKYESIWGRNNDLLQLKPQTVNDSMNIWPLLWFVKLKRNANFDPSVPEQLNNLVDMGKNIIPFVESTCPLCKTPFFSIFDLRHHISSLLHKQVVTDYYRQLEDSD